MSNQFITLKIKEEDQELILTFVYAKCNKVDRRALWADLEGVVPSNIPWIVSGDFNIIRLDSERRRGRPCSRVAMEDFNVWVQNCGLVDMLTKGNSSLWSNGQEASVRS